MSEPAVLTKGLTVVPGEDFPLPPAELIDQLDNSGPSAAPAPAPTLKAAHPVATLDFVDGPPGVDVPLQHRFRWEGQLVDTIRVRPLSVAETSKVIEATPKGRMMENIDFYAAMTGLPADVIRALPGTDGERVTEAAYGFLPRFMTGGASSSARSDGAG